MAMQEVALFLLEFEKKKNKHTTSRQIPSAENQAEHLSILAGHKILVR